MKDQVLATLMNLLARLTSARGVERSRALELIDAFLSHMGLQNKQEYRDLYELTSDVYEMHPMQEQAALDLCKRLRSQFTQQEQLLFGLRVMEFIEAADPEGDGRDELYSKIGEALGIDAETTSHFIHFLHGETDDCVAKTTVGEETAELRLLRIPQQNLLLACYRGEQDPQINGLQLLCGFYFQWPKNGVLRTDPTHVYYHAFANALFANAKEAEGVHMKARNLEFRFPGSDNGLHDFSFDLHSGELVAVMGGSGVGKSTLLSILNGSQAPDSGSLTINGQSFYEHLDELKPLMGFVPQDDLLIPELTVRENLYYTALFCFANSKKEEIDQRVEKTLNDLGLSYIADLKVGTPLQKTISGGQRKRLNIALELIREPAVLFLDEPTSGLSSADSERVMHMLKEQTFRQRLVIVNIHQPSSDIYKLFDRLWLLDKGGYPIYDGNNLEAISHFKRLANLADAESAICPLCGNVTPDVVLSIVEQPQLDAHGKYKDERVRSAQDWHQLYLEERESQEKHANRGDNEKEPKPLDSITSKPSALRQYGIYLRRTLRTFLSDKQAVVISLLEAPLLAAIVAWLTHYAGENGYTLMDNKNLMSYMFMAIIVAIFMGMSGSAESIFRDRAILRREQFLHLSYGAYIASKVTHAALVVGLQTVLFAIVGNGILHVCDLFFVWWAVLFTSGLLAALIGLILSQRMRTIVSIYITIPLLLIPQILLCGLVVPFTDLMPHSKTNYVPIIGEVIPSRWAFEALAVTTFTDNDYMCQFFCKKALQSEMQLAREGQIRLMERGLEKEFKNYYTSEQERLDNIGMLRGETERLVARWDLTPCPFADKIGEGKMAEATYRGMKNWLENADQALHARSMTFTRAIDADSHLYVQEHGKGSLTDLKMAHTNAQLEMVLTNAQSTRLMHQEQDVLVPDVAAIYLAPTSNWGRAPFYAHRKQFLGVEFTTLQYNMLVLWLMIVLAGGVLLWKR